MTRQDTRFSLIVAGLLALTLGLKFLLLGSGARPAHQRFAIELAGALQAQGHATRILPRKTQSWVVEASYGTCLVWLRAASGGIGLKHMFQDRMGDIGSVRYFVSGKEHAIIPAWQVQLQELAQRSARRLGIDFAVPPVLALAAKPGCVPDMVRLSRIAMHYRLGAAIEQRFPMPTSTTPAGESRSLGTGP
jgi:hypothetical protein